MNEMLLQFIWQYSLYNPVGLQTSTGERLTIVHPGKRNHHAGPDFEEARIRVGDTLLVGSIELHLRTSDWHRHGHEQNPSYQKIILHVVFEDDDEYPAHNFPKLMLKPYIPAYVIAQYTSLLQTAQPIACSRQLARVNSLTKESWLNRLLAERWEQKLGDWKALLAESAGDWSSLLYWRIAANFGFKVNADPFLALARSIPLNVLGKHKDNLHQLEALLFGQAGMLEDNFRDDYPNDLKREYDFLRRKYQLQPLDAHLWKYLRMRPANFPSIRIAQFAMLIHRSVHLFSKIIESGSIRDIHILLDLSASDYWSSHYRFDEPQKKAGLKCLGSDSIDNIIINTVAPIQFLYAHYHGKADDQERALNLLTSVAAEQNRFITLWRDSGWSSTNAAQSQALLQLFHRYCSDKRCLECTVGLSIIKSGPDK